MIEKLRVLGKSVREYKKPAIITPILVTCEVVLEVIIPLLMAKLIDEGIYAGEMSSILKIGLTLIFASILSLIFGVTSGITASKASAGFAKNLRKDLYYKVQDFSFHNIDKFSTASIVTRLTTDVSYIQIAFQMLTRIVVRTPLMLVFSLIMAFTWLGCYLNINKIFINNSRATFWIYGLILLVRYCFSFGLIGHFIQEIEKKKANFFG